MASSSTSAVESEVRRIRELSARGQHSEALAAAKSLAIETPKNRDVLYLIAANLRCLNQIPEALATLQKLEQDHSRFSLLHQEKGHCYMILRDAPRAIDAFLRAVNLNPALVKSWSMLERLYHMMGEEEKAAKAAGQLAAMKQLPPEVVQAGSLFSDGDLSAAEKLLRTYLRKGGNHFEALRLLGRIQHQHGVLDEAEQLLEASAEAAPNYLAARADYVRILIDRQKYTLAIEEVAALRELEPANRHYLALQATAYAELGCHHQAVEAYRQLLEGPVFPELYLLLGHSLRSLGQQKEAIESYKAALAVKPDLGDSYWSLANLKTYRFSQDEIELMRSAEAAPTTTPVDRFHLCFALGKAYEDRSDYAEAWQFYERGNRFKRAQIRYDPDALEIITRKQMEVCTAEFFASRVGVGALDPDPIFVVGLPRSGSTLLEQILASHSQVEGTQELYDIQRMVVDLQGPRSDSDDPRYPGILADLPAEEFCRLGERYLTDTRPYRSHKPFFIDKMPNNFRHVGFIHLILPNAKIIDVRREPMACCFSNLKQLFASGQEFTYSVEDIARYYRTYLDLMRHWDAVLPGRVLRVSYEDLVDDLQGNLRRILEFCGLPFEAACVEFYKTERSVRTPSSEQVRRPIFREGLDQWRNYEPWLGPLKEHLGDALLRYRE